MLKVLHIISGLNMGGAEVALNRLITNFNDNNYCHIVVSLTKGGSIMEALKMVNVRVYEFDFKKNFIKDFFKLLVLLKNTKPDIVNTWMYHANLIGGIAAYILGHKRIIWSLRTTDVRKGSKILTIFIRKISALFSYFIPKKIVCVAEAVLQAHQEIGYCKNKMIIIHNGFDASKIIFNKIERQRLRDQFGFKSSEVIIGSVGRFNKAKDHKNFIHAAAIIIKEKPNVKFLMVGKDLENDNVLINKWAKDVHVSSKLILLGERQDISNCLSAMDIFCLHSSREGFPNSLAEAMLVGLPCISTAVGDVEILIRDIGLMVPKENSPALAKGLIELIEMPSKERSLMGQKARKKIYEEFSIYDTCERYKELYGKLLMDSKS